MRAVKFHVVDRADPLGALRCQWCEIEHRVTNHLCKCCGGEKADHDWLTCERCRTRRRRNNIVWLRKHGIERKLRHKNKKYVAPSTLRIRAAVKALRKERIAAGVCSNCGGGRDRKGKTCSTCRGKYPSPPKSKKKSKKAAPKSQKATPKSQKAASKSQAALTGDSGAVRPKRGRPKAAHHVSLALRRQRDAAGQCTGCGGARDSQRKTCSGCFQSAESSSVAVTRPARGGPRGQPRATTKGVSQALRRQRDAANQCTSCGGVRDTKAKTCSSCKA